MNNSQTSDIFCENSIVIEDSPLDNDDETYESILLRIKTFFSGGLVKEDAFPQTFLSSLDDCFSCISRSLETIVSLLSNGDVQVPEIQNYMEDAVSLLQMLSHFIKNIVETLVMTWSVLSSFPITTGRIILIVFTHCKDSESLYGRHLSSIEKQLKDLFRSCHELQLIYLMILEKHFLFDITHNDDQNILLEALDINLRIGEIVQALDVKTMADQWKAYTAICEKYSSNLMDKDIYNKCSELLCKMIEENIKTALKNEEQDKVVLRSLKIASFTIKILLKVSNMFKHGSSNNYECILKMLIFVFMKDSSILGGISKKSLHLTSQMNSLVLNTTQSLLSQLLLDERFFSCLVRCDTKKAKDDNQLGYVLLLIATIRSILQFSEELTTTLSKTSLIDSVLNTLPYSHVFYNKGLEYKLNDEETYDLEQYYLTHVVALCMTLSADEFAIVEGKLFKSVLSVNSCIALYSSKLWVLLSRVTSRQYTLATMIYLCKTYEKLERDNKFHNSPQEVQLAKTIEGMFEHSPNEDKIVLSKQLDVQNESRWNLLKVLKIKNLPGNIRFTTEESVLEKLALYFNKLRTCNMNGEQDMKSLTAIIEIASTSSFTELNPNLEECIANAWHKACPRNLFDFPKNIDSGIYWYFTFLKGLIKLTDVAIEMFDYFDNVTMIHNILTSIILTQNEELILSAIGLYCKVSLYLIVEEPNSALDTINQTLRYLLFETETLIKRYVLSELFKYRDKKSFNKTVLKIISESSELKEIWNHIENNNLNEEWKKWITIADYSFVHKCVESKHDYHCMTTRNKKSMSNFELDIDNLFEGESDSDEPASKKAKMDNEAEDIIKRLEQDSLLLSQCRVTDEYKKRISAVCSRLRNIL